MRVLIDNHIIWSGSVGSEALAFEGFIGLRSENVRLHIELRVARPLEPHPNIPPAAAPPPKKTNSAPTNLFVSSNT